MKSISEDAIRLKAVARKPIANRSLANLSATRIASCRDKRLKQVSNGTVIRELAYTSLIRTWQDQVTPVQKLRLFTIDELIRLANLSGRFRVQASHRYTGQH